jgi:hypothetical protein
MKDGRRALLLVGGGVEVAPDVLPGQAVVDVIPERLGGGFLFREGKTSPRLYKADTWLGPAHAFYTHYSDVTLVRFGFDRIYLDSPQSRAAVDKDGVPLDLGSFPEAPTVRSLVVLDGWHGVAVTDGRGVLFSSDSGATWDNLPIPIEATIADAADGMVYVSGPTTEPRPHAATFAIKKDGSFVEVKSREVHEPGKPKADETLGMLPLGLAVESGIPLEDGTALIAKDGALARVKLDDGTVTSIQRDAFEMKSTACQPIRFSEIGERAWGFACSEPRGRTVLYRYDGGELKLLRQFSEPRVVLASGTGGLAIRGGCNDVAQDKRGSVVYCVYSKGSFRDVTLSGDVGYERVTVLADGRVAVLNPPSGDLATARLTLVDPQGHAKTTTLDFSETRVHGSKPLETAMRLGMWLDGFEERDGKVCGWVEYSGSMIGVRIGLDGRAEVGDLIVDNGRAVVSGRFGLGFGDSKRGYETTDGGMSWKQIEVPGKLAEKAPRRGCGPIGCRTHGWIRVGWEQGDAKSELRPLPLSSAPPRVVTQPMKLECEVGYTPTKAPTKTAATTSDYGGRMVENPQDFPPLGGVAGPSFKKEEKGFTLYVSNAVSRGPTRPDARVYGMGPRGTPWDEQNASWVIRWESAYGAEVHRSAAARAPFFVVDAGRSPSIVTTGYPRRYAPSYYYGGLSIAVAEDPKHALLVARRVATPGVAVFTLDDERTPQEITRSDGEPFNDVEDALRVDKAWYLVSSRSVSGVSRMVVYRVEGTVAREIAQAKRYVSRYGQPTLIRYRGRNQVGLLMEGEFATGTYSPKLWVRPLDNDGQTAVPVPLHALDASDVGELAMCDEAATGWSYPSQIASRRIEAEVGKNEVGINVTGAQLVDAPGGACVLRLHAAVAGRFFEAGAGPAGSHESIKGSNALFVEGGHRHEMRCK